MAAPNFVWQHIIVFEKFYFRELTIDSQLFINDFKIDNLKKLILKTVIQIMCREKKYS